MYRAPSSQLMGCLNLSHYRHQWLPNKRPRLTWC